MARKSIDKTSAAAELRPYFPDWPAAEGRIGLDTLVGHERPRAMLGAALREGRLPHALLFVGPDGVGKRTAALCLAAQWFCAEGTGCGRCDACIRIRRGTFTRIVIVQPRDQKSLIVIDQVKELQQELAFRTLDEKGRITLVLGAERMTPDSQDAFLKTLEEPPLGNHLVLTAHRLDGVLPTIRSRCQRLSFQPLSEAEMEQWAARNGIELGVPVALAMGCPGLLKSGSDPQVAKLREGVARMLAVQRGSDDYARVAGLLRLGLDKQPDLSTLRRRAQLLLRVMASMLRDRWLMKLAGAATAKIRNLDLRSSLLSVSSSSSGRGSCHERDLGDLQVFGDAGSPGDDLELLAKARRALDLNIDPAAAVLIAVPAPQ